MCICISLSWSLLLFDSGDDEAVRSGKTRLRTCMRTLSLCFGGYGGTETLPPPYYRYHHHHYHRYHYHLYHNHRERAWYGRGGEKSGVWRWMWLCCRVGVRQRGREETQRGKFDVRTRRINGCFWRMSRRREMRARERESKRKSYSENVREMMLEREREADLDRE